MGATVWSGTIPANQHLTDPVSGGNLPNLVVSFGFNLDAGEFTVQNNFLLEADSGYSNIQAYVTLLAGTGGCGLGADLSTVLAESGLLQLSPTASYTLTITEND